MQATINFHKMKTSKTQYSEFHTLYANLQVTECVIESTLTKILRTHFTMKTIFYKTAKLTIKERNKQENTHEYKARVLCITFMALLYFVLSLLSSLSLIALSISI